jgi:ribonuclease E
MSTTTSPLAAALDGLPAKPRVHELAKRSGASSREIIAALADRGVTVTSASSSVDRDTALAVVPELLGEPETTAASAVE